MTGPVQKALQLLSDDYERQGNQLSHEDVERVIHKRHLSPEESLLVYEGLSRQGIELALDEPLGADLVQQDPAHATGGALAGSELSRLLRAAGHRKLLTPQEEVELSRSIALATENREALESHAIRRSRQTDAVLKRGADATERMILSNLRLVVSIARGYIGHSTLDLFDLIQEGIFGLMKAVERFDHTLGYKFSTYAVWWIRQSITRSIMDRGSVVRFPVHRVESIRRLQRVTRFLERLHHRRPTVGELADELRWSPDKIHFLQQLSRLAPVSLDHPVGDEEDFLIRDSLASPIQGPAQNYEDIEQAERIRDVLRELSPKEQEIVTARFGLLSGVEETLEQIGERFGVTRERIRQIEKKALLRLQKKARRHHLDDFWEQKD